ncbi:hypothetical protein [Streptomyces sp. NPDC059862]|uniref:hypothetical protein n=1 Tax=unclassified Streptomyces TaxID=2593676 RepID=UPI00363DDCE9
MIHTTDRVLVSDVELIEITPDNYLGVEAMRATHKTWDGLRPIRDYAESAAR